MANAFQDTELLNLIDLERARIENELNLIASENYPSPALLEIVGSPLMNKYAEGYPGKRYYAGCKVVDQIEMLAIERCKKLFGADHANVQPHAGSQANMAVYMAALKPGATILGMSLSAGGHLTHGSPVSFSGKLYNIISYGVDPESELIDYDAVAALAQEHKPALIIAGASAYSRIIDFERFDAIAKSVNAYFMADVAHIAGIIAAKLHPSPVQYADFVTATTQKTLRGPRGGFILCKSKHAETVDRAVMPGIQGGPFMNVIAAKAHCFAAAATSAFVDYQRQLLRNAKTMCKAMQDLGYRIVSGTTENHLFIVDLSGRDSNGKEAEQLLESAGIIVSRSTIPFDTQKPALGSGIRIGSPAMTSRGMRENEALMVAQYVHDALSHKTDTTYLQGLKEKVHALCRQFPVYKE